MSIRHPFFPGGTRPKECPSFSHENTRVPIETMVLKQGKHGHLRSQRERYLLPC